MLSKEQKDKYLENSKICPYCGSNKVEADWDNPTVSNYFNRAEDSRFYGLSCPTHFLPFVLPQAHRKPAGNYQR